MPSVSAISLTNVSKKYRLYASPADRLKESLNPFARNRGAQEHWALRDVSLDVKEGETLGILGRNGAGKSTLLQIVTSVLSPSSGSVTVNGKVSALLELGVGFAPDMTGRENVLAQALLMGSTRREMRERLPAIEAFADIGSYIDQPVRTYSSGMFVRLAFAVAMSVDPDIVIIDEALAVGDAAFQEKCFRRLRELKEQGKTFLLVSHSAAMISQLCDRVAILEGGMVDFVGSPRAGLIRYGEIMFGTHVSDESPSTVLGSFSDAAPIPVDLPSGDDAWAQTDEGDVLHLCPGYNPAERRNRSHAGEIIDCRISSKGTITGRFIELNAQVDVFLKVRFLDDVPAPRVAISFQTPEGVLVYGVNTRMQSLEVPPGAAGEARTFRFSFVNRLAPGSYLVSLWLMAEEIAAPLRLDTRESVLAIESVGNAPFNGLCDLTGRFSIVC